MPLPQSAGNVLRPATQLKLSVRLPPSVNATVAASALKRALEHEPPYGARVSFHCLEAATGWSAPHPEPWLEECLRQASGNYFGAPPCFIGEGGTIPFMAMLGQMFPEAQFLVTGVLGPNSNAHGPNEFLHLPTARRISAALVDVLSALAVQAAKR
jgi:acetylornithine deacetylase/succinyl-diaminopimelate desuccinylase-like protein